MAKCACENKHGPASLRGTVPYDGWKKKRGTAPSGGPPFSSGVKLGIAYCIISSPLSLVMALMRFAKSGVVAKHGK